MKIKPKGFVESRLKKNINQTLIRMKRDELLHDISTYKRGISFVTKLVTKRDVMYELSK